MLHLMPFSSTITPPMRQIASRQSEWSVRVCLGAVLPNLPNHPTEVIEFPSFSWHMFRNTSTSERLAWTLKSFICIHLWALEELLWSQYLWKKKNVLCHCRYFASSSLISGSLSTSELEKFSFTCFGLTKYVSGEEIPAARQACDCMPVFFYIAVSNICPLSLSKCQIN